MEAGSHNSLTSTSGRSRDRAAHLKSPCCTFEEVIERVDGGQSVAVDSTAVSSPDAFCSIQSRANLGSIVGLADCGGRWGYLQCLAFDAGTYQLSQCTPSAWWLVVCVKNPVA